MSRSYVPAALRREIAARARYRCGYCQTSETIAGTPMEVEHIVPEFHGGKTTQDNLWLACPLCNRHKGHRIAAEDPVSGQTVTLFDPRLQSWEEHFSWTDFGTRITGLTAIGRVTRKRSGSTDPCWCGLVLDGWKRVGTHPGIEPEARSMEIAACLQPGQLSLEEAVSPPSGIRLERASAMPSMMPS